MIGLLPWPDGVLGLNDRRHYGAVYEQAPRQRSI
jgi:hypothetical protein